MSEHIVPVNVYLKTWLALLILLGATVGLAYLPLGEMHIVVALGIAFAKAILIILFFMHVKYKSNITWIYVTAGLFWLCIMFTLALGDYLTRGWLPTTTPWTR